jgi:hypothetical protein
VLLLGSGTAADEVGSETVGVSESGTKPPSFVEIVTGARRCETLSIDAIDMMRRNERRLVHRQRRSGGRFGRTDGQSGAAAAAADRARSRLLESLLVNTAGSGEEEEEDAALNSGASSDSRVTASANKSSNETCRLTNSSFAQKKQPGQEQITAPDRRRVSHLANHRVDAKQIRIDSERCKALLTRVRRFQQLQRARVHAPRAQLNHVRFDHCGCHGNL